MSALSAAGSDTLKSMLSGQGNKIIAYLKNPLNAELPPFFFPFGLHLNEGYADT